MIRVAALLSLLAAAVLIVFAADVLRWSDQLAEQDLAFAAAPGPARFEEPSALLPFGLAKAALDGEDDLRFRRQLQAFGRIRPGTVADALEFEQLRGETQLALAELSRVDPDPRRRSRAANMLGVLALDPQRAPVVQEDFEQLVQGAIDAFRSAVETDPANADAKRNLELALRLPGAAVLAGDDPSGSRDVGRLAGLGSPGTGY